MSDDKDKSYDPGIINEKGTYLFMEEFTDSTCKNAIEFILTHNYSSVKLPFLNLVINSPGGSLSGCFALIDTMKGSNIPIHTTGLGVVASCGILTFMSGEKGHRVITPNTSILSHQFSWGSFGKEHELMATVREFELTKQRMIDHYRKCTGLDDETLKEVLLPPQDVWLSAEEAVKYNVADEIKEVY